MFSLFFNQKLALVAAAAAAAACEYGLYLNADVFDPIKLQYSIVSCMITVTQFSLTRSIMKIDLRVLDFCCIR